MDSPDSENRMQNTNFVFDKGRLKSKQQDISDVFSPITNQDPDEIYEILELIGKGNYGEVYKALHRQTGTIVAVKKWQVSSDHASLK